MGESGCGNKHLVLSLWWLAALLGCFGIAVGMATGKATTGDVQEITAKVQKIEVEAARSEERLKRIDENMQWLRQKMEAKP